MAAQENQPLGNESRVNLWLSAAQESLKLCKKCSGLTKQSSTLQYLLSPDGLQFRIELGYLRRSARQGCPFCSVVFGKLNYDDESTPELQVLRRRSPRIFSRNHSRRTIRSYRPAKILHLRMRAPWNDLSGENEPLDDDLEEIEMHYKIPEQMPFECAPKGQARWKRLLEFDICAINGEQRTEH